MGAVVIGVGVKMNPPVLSAICILILALCMVGGILVLKEVFEGDILPYIIGFWWGIVMDRIVSKRIVDGVLYFNTSKKEGD